MPSLLRHRHRRMVVLCGIVTSIVRTVGIWMTGSWDADAWVPDIFYGQTP